MLIIQIQLQFQILIQISQSVALVDDSLFIASHNSHLSHVKLRDPFYRRFQVGFKSTQSPFGKPSPEPTHQKCRRLGICFIWTFYRDLLEKTGCEVSTLSEQLKGVFGWNARTTGDGIVPITERGPLVMAMHDVLSGFWQRYPSNNVLRKWIWDIGLGAEKIYRENNLPVRPFMAFPLLLV